MSNEAFNQHIEFGSPFGDSGGLYEVADWAGYMLKTAKLLIEQANPPADARLSADWVIARKLWMEGVP